MNPRILNRDFQLPADGLYMIEAKGYHPIRSRKMVQVIDDKAITTMANRFNSEATAGTLRHGNEMLIDHEHFSGDPDKETVAYGWMQRAVAKSDGLFASNRWTDTGEPKVKGGSYRFFSSEYEPADMEEVPGDQIPEALRNKYPGWKFMRPLRLDGLTLTNMPNNRGQRPITNREALRQSADGKCPDCNCDLADCQGADCKVCPQCHSIFAGASASAANQTTKNQVKNKMKNIATKLGLAAEASEDAILAEVTKLLNRGEISTTDLTTLRSEHKTFKEQNQTLLGEQVDALLDAHGAKEEKVRNRLKPILGTMKDRAERVAALIDFGFKPVEPTKGGTQQTKLFNRDTKAPTGGKTGTEEKDAAMDQSNATKVMNRANEIQRDSRAGGKSGVSLATAVRMAQREQETAA
jgi:hypothetical protein